MKKLIYIGFSCVSFSVVAQTHLYHFEKNEKSGFIDSVGNEVISPQFDHAGDFSEGLASVYVGNKVGYVNHLGKMVIKPTFDRAFEFKDHVAIVIVDTLYGLIDQQGNYLLRPIYQYMQFQNEGKIGVKKNDLWGFYSLTGKSITPIKYRWIGKFSEGLAMIQSNETGKQGFINTKGREVLPCTLEAVYSPFVNGYAAVADATGKNCYINKYGLNVFGVYFDRVDQFNEGKAFVRKTFNSDGYFIDTTGQPLFNRVFKQVWWFNDGLCGAETDSGFVVINAEGTTVFSSKTIEWRFCSGEFGFFCDHSSEELTWGIMNKQMEILSDERFIEIFQLPSKQVVETYSGDPALWYGHGKRGYIDNTGKTLWREDD
jgi:hypothetical protein